MIASNQEKNVRVVAFLGLMIAFALPLLRAFLGGASPSEATLPAELETAPPSEPSSASLSGSAVPPACRL